MAFKSDKDQRCAISGWMHDLAELFSAEPLRLARYLPGDSPSLGRIERRLRRNLLDRVSVK